MAVLRDLQRMVRDRQRVEFQRRPAEVKERVRVRRRLRLARRVRAVRQEERLPLREERRAVALRVRDARRRMLVMGQMLAMEEERRAAVLRIRAARRGMRVKEERKERLLKQRPERREPMREVMTME